MEDFFSSIFSMISGFKVTDVLDIAIVAFILYKLIGFLRETRAEQLLKGIVMIAAAYVISIYLDLQVINYVIRVLVENSIIILVIVFHPELRKVLEQVGKSRLRKFAIFGVKDEAKEREESLVTVNGVSEAFKRLQAQRMGALVVFERELSLSDIAVTGTIVDAEVNAAILANIFFNKAPLHDGAAIIRNNRIYSAGCILPLTDNNSSVDSNLGTRHRAALGMSESSDAIVAVVSEETGTMSIAYHGKLSRFDSPVEFSANLLALIAPDTTKEDEEQSKIKSMLSFVPFIKASRGKSSKKEAKDDE
ncbi:MAG: diadenylate cyclase CdaA [Oscillospiraceae bacterium]|jgi:diadenylate cyclase|nr:diadenylate cyclase CdaA [Oscillospiraceae bacterium]